LSGEINYLFSELLLIIECFCVDQLYYIQTQKSTEPDSPISADDDTERSCSSCLLLACGFVFCCPCTVCYLCCRKDWMTVNRHKEDAIWLICTECLNLFHFLIVTESEKHRHTSNKRKDMCISTGSQSQVSEKTLSSIRLCTALFADHVGWGDGVKTY
jgi:hypothetical protein